jgi:hypothetical protein
MEEEHQAGLADDLDSSKCNDSDEEENEEEILIPSSWNRDLSTIMIVNDFHDSALEYHKNNISARATYSDKTSTGSNHLVGNVHAKGFQSSCFKS